MVKQMLGEYRVKNTGLQPLYEEARRLAARIGHVTFEHVRREHNQDADRLANEAMDEAADWIPALASAASMPPQWPARRHLLSTSRERMCSSWSRTLAFTPTTVR
jgi:hypothetical protein